MQDYPEITLIAKMIVPMVWFIASVGCLFVAGNAVLIGTVTFIDYFVTLLFGVCYGVCTYKFSKEM